MLVQQVRSGLVETTHDGAVAVVAPDGVLIASYGDIDRPFYLRSAAKPFQAYVSRSLGADLSPLELAIVCSSHRGYPVHVSLVESVLSGGGIDETALGCPPDWPLRPSASAIVQRQGARRPRRIWHNCSGKHAGFLRACVANGWPLDTYLDPEHPLQRQVVATVSELGEYPTTPVGVDGCGAPVLRTTARALGLLFARLGSDTALADVFEVMHRYPALIAANGESDTEIAITTNSVAKGGAAGCIGVSVRDRFGIGVKSWDGVGVAAGIAAASALAQMGVPSPPGLVALDPVLNPVVSGGGRPVGVYESVYRLDRA